MSDCLFGKTRVEGTEVWIWGRRCGAALAGFVVVFMKMRDIRRS